MSQLLNFVNSSRYRNACEQGSVFSPTIYIVEPCTQTPVDLTDMTVKMQVRPSAGSSTLILTISTANGYAVVTPLEGKISILVPSAITAPLTPGLYVYDLDLIDGDANSRRVLEGQFEITAEVTT